jgi:hypothetical protein
VDTGGYLGWKISNSPGALANLVANIEKYEMGKNDTASVLQMGTLAVRPHTVTGPQSEIANSPSRSWVDFCFIKPGWTLQLWHATVQRLVLCGLLFEDCPAGQLEA